MMPAQLKAICQTLAASVQSGLNATLTPEDCRELLKAVMAATRAMQTAPKPQKRPLDRFVDGVADIAAGFVEDFAAEFNTAPKRRRKKGP
jgi:hypothetical protein